MFRVTPVPTFALANVNTGEPPKVTSSPTSKPDKLAVPVAEPAVPSSYTLLSPVKPVIVNPLAVMFADKVGCVSVYFPASVPLIVYPVVFRVIPVPTFALAKVKTGEPLNVTVCPDAIPDKLAVPVALPELLSSYTLLFPVNPVTVNAPLDVVKVCVVPSVVPTLLVA